LSNGAVRLTATVLEVLTVVAPSWRIGDERPSGARLATHPTSEGARPACVGSPDPGDVEGCFELPKTARTACDRMFTISARAAKFKRRPAAVGFPVVCHWRAARGDVGPGLAIPLATRQWHTANAQRRRKSAVGSSSEQRDCCAGRHATRRAEARRSRKSYKMKRLWPNGRAGARVAMPSRPEFTPGGAARALCEGFRKLR
jgi:hypothetical protein